MEKERNNLISFMVFNRNLPFIKGVKCSFVFKKIKVLFVHFNTNILTSNIITN